MSFSAQSGSILGGTNPIVGAPALAQSIQAPALAQPNQAPVPSQVPGDANRANAAMLAQAPQAIQAPQAQSPKAQINSLFSNLDPMKALNLFKELMTPFMSMLGMGTAPAAEKPAQDQLGQAPQAQDPQTLQAINQVMAQLGQGQAPQAQDPQTLQAIDQVMAQLGQGQAMLENILNQNPQNGTPTEQKVFLASQDANKPAPTQASTLAA